MPDRRTFFRRAGAGAAAAALLDARALFANRLSDVERRSRSRDSFSSLAEEYLLGPDVLYLNHGSIGTIPRAVHEARRRYLTLCETNPWLYMWGGAWDEAREATRAKAAALLRCDATEVAFTHNTTEAFNLLALGLPLRPGDEVLFSSLNHPGASNAWTHNAARRGYTVRRFELPIAAVPEMSADELVERHVREITDRTRVLVIPHVDNTVGMQHPVHALAAAARSRGVDYIAVDGAQALGMLPVDVGEDGIDFYAASPHKWLQAPKGLGLLYVRTAVRDTLHPMWVSSGQGQGRDTARVFEDYGTRNLAEVLTLGDAIDFQQALGEDAKVHRYRVLRDSLLEATDGSPHLRWHSPRDPELFSSIVLIEVLGRSSGDLFDALYRGHGVVFRAFHTPEVDAARISPNVQTTDAEISRFLTLVEQAANG
jgi:selenocysteine lyase/cysteine desulfurase